MTNRMKLLTTLLGLGMSAWASVGAWAEEGHRFLASCSDKHIIAIVNTKGEIEWQEKIGGLHDLHMLPNGNILFQKNFHELVEMTPADKKVVWSYDSGKMNGNEGKPVEVHAFQRLPDGNTFISESGPARFIIVDKDGKIVKEIKMKVEHHATHSDTRLARYLPNDHILASHESDGTVREYDLEGKVVWEFPIPLFDKPRAGGHGPEAFGNQTFAPLRLANGNTLISTGNGHSVLEVTPAKEIVWKLTQDELPGIKFAWITTLEVLPNGNIVIDNCHAGPDNPQIVEITKDKKVVWTYKNFKDFGNSFTNTQVLDAPGSIR